MEAINEMELPMSFNNKPINMMGRQVQADLSQKTTGNFEIELIIGMLTLAKTKSNMEGTILVMEKVVPVKIKTIKEIIIKKM